MKDIIRTPTPYTETSIKNAYDQFGRRVEHLRILDNAYFTGRTGTEAKLAKLSVNYCKYISDTKASFVAGIPPVYEADAEDVKGQEIVDLYNEQTLATLDQQLVKDASRYGRGIELEYMDMVDNALTPQSVQVSPLDGFIAYDQTLNPKPVFGAIHYAVERDDGTVDDFLDVYDDKEVVRYQMTGAAESSAWVEVPGTRRLHGFSSVPMVEYLNNPDCIGDFEPILDLQTSLNEMLSDRIRDKNRFASAIMVAKGMSFGDSDEEVDEVMGTVKEDEYISIPRDSDLTYLTKVFDEASVQILVDDVTTNIHKITGIPDLSDENFASNTSGVAMKYKLLGLLNVSQALEAEFRKGFRRRCRLYSSAMFGDAGADVRSMDVKFRFNLPTDPSFEAQSLQIFIQNGLLSRETALGFVPYVDDVQEELERIRGEEEEQDARQRRQEVDFLNGNLGQDMTPEDEDDI